MKHKFSLAKPYGLADQNLCYIQTLKKSLRKRQRMFLGVVGEYGSRKYSLNILGPYPPTFHNSQHLTA